jgi:hypothetical protein
VKTQSVESVLPYKAAVVAGSTDYVDFMENRRDSFFWIKGSYFGKVPMFLDLRLSTVDAPNAGSVLFDVIRAVKLALDRSVGGVLTSVSATHSSILWSLLLWTQQSNGSTSSFRERENTKKAAPKSIHYILG